MRSALKGCTISTVDGVADWCSQAKLSKAVIQVQGPGKFLAILPPQIEHNSLPVKPGIVFNSPCSPVPKLLPGSNTKFHKGDPIMDKSYFLDKFAKAVRNVFCVCVKPISEIIHKILL